jgi:hypothetical protein
MVRKKVPRKRRVVEKIDPVFLPIVQGIYKKNKVNLLRAQVKVLECVKTINKIKLLQKEKDSLKLQLYRNLSDVLRFYYQTQSVIPVINSPGNMKRLERTLEVSVNYTEGDSSIKLSKVVSKTDELDDELREIQEKLNSLNSVK